MRDPRQRQTQIALIVLLGVFVWHAASYWFLIDDAYISFRYARNLIDGHGLVYNPGERVEGYSNLLWVLLMSAGMAARILPETLSRVAGLVAGLLSLVVVWRLGLRILTRDGGSRWLALVPVVLLVSNRSVAAWATSGLETRFFTFLLLAGLWLLAGELDAGPRAAPWSALPLAMAVLTRVDGFVPVGIVVGAVVIGRRGRPGRHGFALAAGVAGAFVAQTLFRLAYYGDLLPNTFHVKVAGWPIALGLEYLRLASVDYGLPLAVALSVLAILPPSRDFMTRLLAVVAGVQLAYVVSVGGDHFEFRFLDPIWPLLAVLSVAGIRRIVAMVPGVAGRGIAIALLVVLLAWNAVPAFTGFDSTFDVISLEDEARFCSDWTEVGRWFRDHADPNEVIALTPAGVIPYTSGLRALDMLGLNDRVIARRPVNPDNTMPGHRKNATYHDVLIRGGVSYVIGHPDLQRDEPTLPPPEVVDVEGRRFAMFSTRAQTGQLWLRFVVVSEDAASGGSVDPSRVRTRIRP